MKKSEENHGILLMFKDFSLQNVIGIAVIVASATWYIRADYIDELKNRLDVYEKSDQWRLPETLNKINNAVTNLNLSIDEKKRLQVSEKTVQELEALNKKMSHDLSIKTDELNEAQKELSTYNQKNEPFSIKIGESHLLLKNHTYVALKYVSSNNVDVLLDNLPYNMSIGETREYGSNGLKCKLTITKIEYGKSSADFSNICI